MLEAEYSVTAVALERQEIELPTRFNAALLTKLHVTGSCCSGSFKLECSRAMFIIQSTVQDDRVGTPAEYRGSKVLLDGCFANSPNARFDEPFLEWCVVFQRAPVAPTNPHNRQSWPISDLRSRGH